MMDFIEFEESKYFYYLLLLPVFVIVFLLVLKWKKKKQKEFGAIEMVQKMSPENSVLKQWIKFILYTTAAGLIIIALVNPKIGTSIKKENREGVDIVFAIDISKSMLAEDIAPSRLSKSKQLVSQIINQLKSDRIGIVAYAGSAFPLLPLTTDFSSAKMYMQSLNTSMVSSQGTALDDALNIANTFFAQDKSKNKLIVMITDGEDHSENLANALQNIKDNNIKIVTIGVGTEKGANIPIKTSNGVELKKDNQGIIVVTKLNKQVLENIAKETNGGYVDGTITKKVVKFVENALDNVEKKEFESKKTAHYQSQFQWFLGLALILLLIDSFLLEKTTTWLTRLNLFNEKKKNDEK